jgi:hypothetical protein
MSWKSSQNDWKTLHTETLSPRDRKRTPTAARIYIWGNHCTPNEIGRKDEKYIVGAGEPYYEPRWAAKTTVRMYML